MPSSYLKLLGVYFDQKLSYDYHVGELCRKAEMKVISIGTFDENTQCCKQNDTFSYIHIVTVRVLLTCMTLLQQR